MVRDRRRVVCLLLGVHSSHTGCAAVAGVTASLITLTILKIKLLVRVATLRVRRQNDFQFPNGPVRKTGQRGGDWAGDCFLGEPEIGVTVFLFVARGNDFWAAVTQLMRRLLSLLGCVSTSN